MVTGDDESGNFVIIIIIIIIWHAQIAKNKRRKGLDLTSGMVQKIDSSGRVLHISK